jgi:Asp-tRNA(Asn)/Glu-tRNA(Gln) amidotransferase A subunit family amidase
LQHVPLQYKLLQWFDGAEPAVAAACRDALELLRQQGLAAVEIDLPELGLQRAAHW